MVRDMDAALVRIFKLVNLEFDTVDLINKICNSEEVDMHGNYDMHGFTQSQAPIGFCIEVAAKCGLHLVISKKPMRT